MEVNLYDIIHIMLDLSIDLAKNRKKLIKQQDKKRDSKINV